MLLRLAIVAEHGEDRFRGSAAGSPYFVGSFRRSVGHGSALGRERIVAVTVTETDLAVLALHQEFGAELLCDGARDADRRALSEPVGDRVAASLGFHGKAVAPSDDPDVGACGWGCGASCVHGAV